MRSSIETNLSDQSHSFHKNLPKSLQYSNNYFSFLKKKKKEEKSPTSLSFFSKNSLSQDIIEVTGAEPDISLEVFYAFYHTLWPHIEKQGSVSLKDAWIKFIGGAIFKGSLCPPEKLIIERRIQDIKQSFSHSEGESHIFRDLDQVVNSIMDLKQEVVDFKDQFVHKEEIIESLNLLREFYLGFRNQVKTLVHKIIEKEQMNTHSREEYDTLDDLLEHKAIMMSDIFPGHWAYRISRNKALKLLSLDRFGRNLKSTSSDHSNHRVVALPENSEKPLVFFKANGNPPIKPEKEFMLYSLYEHLNIPVPETALIILTDVFETKSDYFYAVQASEAVLGESPLKAYRNPETFFEQAAFASQLIGALLTNPSDGSFKNFKYSPKYKTFVSIDNDMVFKPGLTATENIVNVKSILYLVSQIENIIPETAKTFFMTLDPHLLILAWLQDLWKKNIEYQRLFDRLSFQYTRCCYQNLPPSNETLSLATYLEEKITVDSELHSEEPFYPQILVSANLLADITEKLQKIEEKLRTNPLVTGQALFEEISPVLGKYYRRLRHKFDDPEVALDALWGTKQNGVDYSYVSSLLDNEELTELSNTLMNNENRAPEDFFDEYKNLLILQQPKQSPIDRFIRHQSERKRYNSLNLREALGELRLLVKEELTNSKSIREIVDFCHNLMKTATSEDYLLIKEITSLLCSLPHAELKWLLVLEKYFLREDCEISKDLLRTSLPVTGVFMKRKTFILTENESQYLFEKDSNHNIQKNPTLAGRARVTFFPKKDRQFYLKQFPEWPGYELASTLFMRLLGVTQLPYQDVILMKNSPILLSQNVNGSPVIQVWHDPQAFSNLDPFHIGLLIISAMLINPEDGKEDNFILTEDKKYLIPIDNDHCFLPSTFRKEGNLWNAFTVNTALQTKTLLFCLDEMYMPIPHEVKKHVISIDFDLMLTQWIVELVKVEDRLVNLVEHKGKGFLEQGTVLGIPFYKQFIQNLHWKAHIIQDLLKTLSEPTPFDLLKAIEPFAAKCYQDSFKHRKNLQDRFKAATNQLYTKTAVDGSRFSILNTRTMMEIINVSENDLQNYAIFQKVGPLDALEVLNLLIQERSERGKAEQELLCELDDKDEEKKWISLFGNPTTMEIALKEFFTTSQKKGLILKGSKLITSSKLTELLTQTPERGIKIRFLSLPYSPLLTDKEIRVLAEECPNLEYLNVNGCSKLNKIITGKEEWPLLARVEAKGCLALEKFVSYSSLKTLRIETNRRIEVFLEKPTLDIFTISSKANLFELSLRKGEEFEFKSRGFKMSHDEFLLNVIHQNEKIRDFFKPWKITIGKNVMNSENDLEISVTSINLRDSELSTEDIKRMVALKLINLTRLELSLENSLSLEYLILGNWPKLCHLNLSNNDIYDQGVQFLAQGNWPELQVLHLVDVKITARGVKAIIDKWPKLKVLNLSENQIQDKGLEILSLGNWPLLEVLNLGGIEVAKKAFTYFLANSNWENFLEITPPKSLDCDDQNLLYHLIKKDLSMVDKLEFRNYQVALPQLGAIMEKNENKFARVKFLNLSKNDVFDEGISKLALVNWSLLEELYLRDTKITSIGIEILVNKMDLLSLKKLDISKNDIFDEGLKMLLSGDWVMFEHLVYYNTNVTLEGNIYFLENFTWKNLSYLEHSLSESFYENLEPSEIVLAMVPMYFKKQFLSVAVLDLDWILSKEIYLNEKIILLPREKLKEFEDIKVSFKEIETTQLIVWPSNLKRLDLSGNSLSDEKIVESLLFKNCPLLEDLDLNRTQITAKGIEILLSQGNFLNLKKVDISYNPIGDKGLEILASASWPLLENLNLEEIQITAQGIEILILEANWLNLKRLSVTRNLIEDGGIRRLSLGEWPLLENLSLRKVGITEQGIDNMVCRAGWPNLKILDLSWNLQVFGPERQDLIYEKWPNIQLKTICYH